MGERARTILVVDDDDDLRAMVELVLETEGYDVRRARDGQEALDAMRVGLPDLILLDMRMPRMSGWEFGKRLHELHGHDVPLVVMTAAEHADKRAREVDAEDFVAKPFDVENLHRVVARHLPR